LQTLTNLGTPTDYIDKALYEVSESERKTKIDEETMKKSTKENDFNYNRRVGFILS
jgi:hypothetical protein